MNIAVATPAILYSHWKLNILKAVLRLKSKVVACVARCFQFLKYDHNFILRKLLT